MVEAHRATSTLYLHVFDLPDAAAVKRERKHALALERRVVEAFGSKSDIEAVRQ